MDEPLRRGKDGRARGRDWWPVLLTFLLGIIYSLVTDASGPVACCPEPWEKEYNKYLQSLPLWKRILEQYFWEAAAAAGIFLIVVILILRSNARFFIAASSIISAVAGATFFDALRLSGLIFDSVTEFEWTVIEFEWHRTQDWRIELPLLLVAGLLYWIDHKRRP